jgi:hypothetical protein
VFELDACVPDPPYDPVTVCVPDPTALGVYDTEHVLVPVLAPVPRTNVHDVPGLENPPAPLDENVTEPDGLDFVPDAVSVTVAVQVEAWASATVAGVHDTAVEVALRPLKVTVRAGLPPRTALQGFVVPVQVEELRLAAALQPPNVDPPLALALNVTVAPLSVVVMLGEQVFVTVCEAAAAPVPPQDTGALTVPVLGVIVTDPVPEPANVNRRLRAAIT